MITTEENELLRRCILTERNRLTVVEGGTLSIEERKKVQAEMDRLGALWNKLAAAVPSEPDSAVVEAVKQAWDKLTYHIDYPFMDDDRPEAYEQAAILLNDKIAKRAKAFRDARD